MNTIKIFNYKIECKSYIVHPLFGYNIIICNNSTLLKIRGGKYCYWNHEHCKWINVKKIKTAYKHAFLELYLNTNIH